MYVSTYVGEQNEFSDNYKAMMILLLRGLC